MKKEKNLLDAQYEKKLREIHQLEEELGAVKQSLKQSQNFAEEMKSESCFQICMSLVTFLTMHVCCNTVSFIVNWEKRFLPRGMITMIFLTLTSVKMNFLSKHMQFLKIYNFESNWCVLTLAAKWISFNTFKSGNFYFLIMRLNSLRKIKKRKTLCKHWCLGVPCSEWS